MTRWKKVKYLKIPWQATDDQAEWLYELWLNEPLASWDVFSYWEAARVLSMREHLKKGDVLFDVGTEQGWCDLVYAHIVGPENMVLIEPTPEFWPNIKALWEKNFPGVMPAGCFPGFLSCENSELISNPIFVKSWPPEANGDLIDRNSYRNLSQYNPNIPEITVDEWVNRKGVPAALTIDVEGAELLVLRGAEKTLAENNLKVWVSEHDDLALKEYQIIPEQVPTFMKSLGYEREVLATDHERHVYYWK